MTDNLEHLSGFEFYRASSMQRSTIKDLQRPSGTPPPPFKKYQDAPKITLPRISWKLNEARIQPLLQQRRSLRKYSAEPLEILDLAFLLWACQGITAQAGKQLLRTSPSAGALYPIETYLSIQNVVDLSPGLYHFDPQSFQLEFIDHNLKSHRLASACLDQSFISSAAFCFIWTAVVGRSVYKYGERGMRYVFLDAAHICQNVLVGAEAIRSGGCPVAAFYDEEMCALLGIDGVEEIPIYAASVGLKG